MNALKRKAVRCSNTQTAIKKNHIEKIMSAIKSVAACARHTCATGSFHCNFLCRHGQAEKAAEKLCATVLVGASNTIEIAGNPPDSGIFSRPEFVGMGSPVSHGFGRDGLVRKAGRMAISMFETSRPPAARSNAASGLQSQIGAETMTTVNTPTTPAQGTIANQQAIENALSTALYFIRLPGTPSALHAATGRANRALSLLKQACTEAKIGGAA